MHFLSLVVGVALYVIGVGALLSLPALTIITERGNLGVFCAAIAIGMLSAGILTTGISIVQLLT
jgi:hypothetical protein